MPPVPTWIAGRDAVAHLFTKRLRETMQAHMFRTVLVEACGTLGVGF